MKKIAELINKIAIEIDIQTVQMENATNQLEENKKLAVSEIFETNHEQNAVDIANYRDTDAKLKNALSLLTSYRNELKQQAIDLINSI
jgi:hypothetical protein